MYKMKLLLVLTPTEPIKNVVHFKIFKISLKEKRFYNKEKAYCIIILRLNTYNKQNQVSINNFTLKVIFPLTNKYNQ